MACPHHDVRGSSASSKDPDCVLSCIFSQTLSHWKARAELNGRTEILFLWYYSSNLFPACFHMSCVQFKYISWPFFFFLSIQYFLELSRPSLISCHLILPYRFPKYLPCLIKDFHKEALGIQVQLLYKQTFQNQRYTCILTNVHIHTCTQPSLYNYSAIYT